MTKKNLITAGIGLAVILVGLMVMLLMPKKYTVTFDTAGGTIMKEVEVKKGTTIGDLEVPTRDGYTFLYWTFNGKECSKTDEITKDIKLIAKWEKNVEVNPEAKKYTIIFDSNGGSTINKQEVEEGWNIEEPNSPTKEGYVFVSWMLENITFDFNTEITKDIILVAKWEKVKEEVKTYTVTFNTDGGSKVTSKTVIEGNKVGKPSNPTKSGYTFVKWTLDGKEYNFNSKVTSNITLKATWKKVETEIQEKSWNVNFKCVETNQSWNVKVKDNEKLQIPSSPNTTTEHNGLVFKYWIDMATGKEFDFNQKVTKEYILGCVWGGKAPEQEPSDEEQKTEITEQVNNIYITNKDFVGINEYYRLKITWDSVKNADSYDIYYSSSKDGKYELKTSTSSLNTQVSQEQADGYYKIQGKNSDGNKGPMSEPIFVPGIIRSSATGSIQCNIEEVRTENRTDYRYNGGHLNLNNTNGVNYALFKVKVNGVGETEYTLFKDLGTTTYYDMGDNAYFKKVNGEYFAIATYKKGSNYLIYSLNRNDIENCTENKTVVYE